MEQRFDREDLRCLWAEDLTLAQIGKEFGVTGKAVWKAAKALDFPKRPRTQRKRVCRASDGAAACATPGPTDHPMPAGLSPLEADVWRGRGRWAALAEAAQVHSVTVTAALQVWHRLRVRS